VRHATASTARAGLETISSLRRRAWLTNGVPPDFNMVPFKDQLKDDEIWNLVNYIRSIAKKK
jgi:mono/diheme cytochrome c family protein